MNLDYTVELDDYIKFSNQFITIMVDSDTILASVYAVVNIIISVMFGFMLAKIGVLTPTTRKVISEVNYYALCPTYCFYFIMQSIDKDRLNDLALIFWSSLPCILITFIITLAISFIMRFDIRMRYSFSFINVYGNLIIMPQMMTDTLCEKGGKYEDTDSCKNGLVKPYSSVPLIYLNILYWVTVLPLLQSERRIALITKKIQLIALNYYDSIEDFLKDVKDDFKNAKFIEAKLQKSENNNLQSPKVLQSPEKLNDEEIHPWMVETTEHLEHTNLITSNSKVFIDAFYQNTLTNAKYKELTTAFAAFEEKVYNQPDNKLNKKILEIEVLGPEKLMIMPKEENIASIRFYIDHILCSPPAICSIIGLILGFIFPFNEWLFDPDHTPLPTFLATFRTIGGMMSPVSMFLLGTYLAQGAIVTRTMLIGWKHVIISNIIKNLIIPAIGLLWICVVFKETSGSSYEDNPILMFISYTYWIVPNGIILIAVYVVADYFAKEFSVLSVYMNILSIPMMTVFLILYFYVYEN